VVRLVDRVLQLLDDQPGRAVGLAVDQPRRPGDLERLASIGGLDRGDRSLDGGEPPLLRRERLPSSCPERIACTASLKTAAC
jgi:hypothetical protein